VILEVAAGTGIVTEALATAFPAATIVATDLNSAMLDIAGVRVIARNVTFQQADA
jgi:ubiquinone/menaquinone biosynthesis C-methylase UbiE